MQRRNIAKVLHFGLLLGGQELGLTLADVNISPQNGLTGQSAHEVGVVGLWQTGAWWPHRSAGPMCGLQTDPEEIGGLAGSGSSSLPQFCMFGKMGYYYYF